MAEDTGPSFVAPTQGGKAPPPRLPDTSEWVSVRAVAWAIDDAPVPADLALTLIVIARRADENGRGSRQSVPTIASKTGKSLAQVRRDIARLRELGLLLLGDQSLAAHYPAGKRPVVYDLPLSVRGPKPTKESRNKSGKGGTPSMDATPSTHATPSMDATSTPRMDAHGTPSIHATQTKPLNNPLNNPSLSARADERPTLVEDRERDEDFSEPKPQDLPHRLVAKRGVTGERADKVIAYLARTYNVGGPGWWITADGNGTLDARIAEALSNIDTGPASDPRDEIPCPLPGHRDRAYNCGTCWGDVNAGQDPYADHPDLRPPDWHDAYPRLRAARRTRPLQSLEAVVPPAVWSRPAPPAPASYPRLRRPTAECRRPDCRSGMLIADMDDPSLIPERCPDCYILSPNDEPEMMSS